MDKIGIIKEFDKLGRIVIPKELRERYGLTNQVEIVAVKEGILLKSNEYYLVRKEERKQYKTRTGGDIYHKAGRPNTALVFYML